MYNSESTYSSMVLTAIGAYLLLVLTSNMLLTRSSPNRFLSTALFLSGTYSLFTTIYTSSPRTLIYARIPLSLTEAITYPAILYTMSCWYKPTELGKRLALFPTVSLIFQSFFSHTSHTFNPRPALTITALATMAAGILALALPAYPATTHSFSRRDRELATIRLLRCGQDTGSSTSRGLERLSHIESLIAAFRDPRTHLFLAINTLTITAASVSHLQTISSLQLAANVRSALRIHYLSTVAVVAASLHRDFLPASWDYYKPTFWDVSCLVGSFGLFFTMYCLFARFLPMVATAEVKTVLPQADPHMGEDRVVLERARPEPETA